MRINNNLMAMNTHRQLGINAGNGAKSIEKLSSGYRINRAGDDAAGLAISEKMRAQIRGLTQASRNSQDAISLVQTAEGALNETQDILQRMRELAVQSANDTNVTIDREAIQNEVDQLTQEIDRIGTTTEFNTRKLLNGGAGVTGAVDIGGVAYDKVSIVSGSADTQVIAGASLQFDGLQAAKAAKLVIDSSEDIEIGTDSVFSLNGVTIGVAAGATGADIATAFNSVSGTTGVTATYDTTNFTLTLQSSSVGSNAKIELNGITNTIAAAAGDTFTTATPAAVTIVDQNGTNVDTALTNGTLKVLGNDAQWTATSVAGGLVAPSSVSASGNTIFVNGGTYDGLVLKVDASLTTATDNIDIEITGNNSLSMQIGANEGQDMSVAIGDMRASALGVSAIDVTSSKTAKSAITTIQDAITGVSSERAKLGAVQNRLEHTIKNLDTSAENLQASESRIRDVDMAKEMMNFTKNNILQQAAQAMLAQANQAPQGVLQLLR